MAKLGTEQGSVQYPLIKYAREIGWEYIDRENAIKLRNGETGLIFKDVFANQTLKLNSDFINAEIIEELIKRIERLPPTKEGNLQAWEYLKGIKNVFVPREKRERNVKLISENINENIFQITDEFAYTNGTFTNRLDVVFLINGIPIFFVETKSSHKIGGMDDALSQVRRYHNETPEPMTLLQIYTLTHIIKFIYSPTWEYSVKGLVNWKIESKEKDFENLVKDFFDKKNAIKTILDYILFTRKDDNLQKVVLRPHQMRAIEKIVERVADKVKKRGLIWHTQGSGKTYTMIVSAQKIIENPIFENPTVIMLVDRNELESQLFGNLIAVGYTEDEMANRTADSKKKLRELLKSDIGGNLPKQPEIQKGEMVQEFTEKINVANVPMNVVNKTTDIIKPSVDNIAKQTDVSKKDTDFQQKSTIKNELNGIPKDVGAKTIDLPKIDVSTLPSYKAIQSLDKTKTVVDDDNKQRNCNHDKPSRENRIGNQGQLHYHVCSKCGFWTWHEK